MRPLVPSHLERILQLHLEESQLLMHRPLVPLGLQQDRCLAALLGSRSLPIQHGAQLFLGAARAAFQLLGEGKEV